MCREEYIQLPPLRKDTDIRVIEALWEYVKLPAEAQKRVLYFMEEFENTRPGEEMPPLEAYRKISQEDVAAYESVMRKIISELIVESCELACWVFYHKFNKGWSLEQMVNQKESAEQFIIVLDLLFDKYMGTEGVKNDDIILS